MAIPDFQTIMLPFLQYLGDGAEHSIRDTREHLSRVFSLSDEERKELLPSGQQPVFNNRVGWARTFLGKAGLLSSTRRGYFQITERGQKVLAQNPDRISRKSLRQFPDYHKAWGTSKPKKTVADDRKPEEITPEKSLEAADYASLEASMENPFSLSDEKLVALLNGLSDWYQKNPE